MFAYCNNNPVCAADPSGCVTCAIAGNDYADLYEGGGYSAYDASSYYYYSGTGGSATWSYGSNIIEFPVSSFVGRLIRRIVAATGTVAMISNCLAPAAYPSKDDDDNKPSQTFIYRYGATKTEKLAPTAEHGDYDGLSFSLNPPTRTKQYPVAVTTIEAVESTGNLTAVQNGTHVSIKPVNGTVIEWIAQGMDSQWSQALSGIIIVIGE